MKQEPKTAFLNNCLGFFHFLSMVNISEMPFLNCKNNNKSLDKEWPFFPLPSTAVSVSAY